MVIVKSAFSLLDGMGNVSSLYSFPETNSKPTRAPKKSRNDKMQLPYILYSAQRSAGFNSNLWKLPPPAPTYLYSEICS